MNAKKLKFYYLGKGWKYLLPRLIIIGYPVVIIGQAYLYSFIFGFDPEALLIAIVSTVIAAVIVYMCLKLKFLGALTLIFLGGFVTIGAFLSKTGFDWAAAVFGGLPLLVAGVMFLWESIVRRLRMEKVIEMLKDEK